MPRSHAIADCHRSDAATPAGPNACGQEMPGGARSSPKFHSEDIPSVITEEVVQK